MTTVPKGIQKADCLAYLASLSDASVDLIINDPPYFIGLRNPKGNQWDNQWQDEKKYLEWCNEWTKQCVRVLKDQRMFIVWGTLKKDAFLRYKLATSELHANVLYPQNEIIWSYNWGGRSKHNFARKHEYAFAWSKGKQFLFNADSVLVERKMTKNIRTGVDFDKGTIPTCVWQHNNHTTSNDYIGWHPTCKNIEVTTRLIEAYSNKNDYVLDCFMGSGTTAIAAIRTGRNYIGCENNDKYYQKLNERIAREISKSRQ